MRKNVRRAVSLILRRPSDGALYLVRRNPELRFFGGYWAFPGGALHEVDEMLAERLAVGETGLAGFRVAALRECFEELGIALCGAELDPGRRGELIASPAHFESMLANVPDPNALVPWIRLLTPDFIPVRFDTTFFSAELTDEQRPVIVDGELVAGEFASAARWLQRWRRGELLIAPPVLLILRIVASHDEAAAHAELERLERGFAAGEIHPIRFNPAARLLPLRTPTLPPAEHTNAYVVGGGIRYLVDPATPHAEEQERLARALGDGGGLRAILLTHHHPDHVGAVEFARRRWRLPVWAHAVTARLLKGRIAIDRELADGDRLPLGDAPDGTAGWELECIFTPGHAAGHLCFYEDRYGSLLCGDMMSTLSSILVHPDDGDMAQYMNSLRRLVEIDAIRMVYPAHGPATSAGVEAIRQQILHREQRELQIASAIAAGAARVREVVAKVYSDVPSSLHGHAASSVRSVLMKLAAEGSADAERLLASD